MNTHPSSISPKKNRLRAFHEKTNKAKNRVIGQSLVHGGAGYSKPKLPFGWGKIK